MENENSNSTKRQIDETDTSEIEYSRTDKKIIICYAISMILLTVCVFIMLISIIWYMASSSDFRKMLDIFDISFKRLLTAEIVILIACFGFCGIVGILVYRLIWKKESFYKAFNGRFGHIVYNFTPLILGIVLIISIICFLTFKQKVKNDARGQLALLKGNMRKFDNMTLNEKTNELQEELECCSIYSFHDYDIKEDQCSAKNCTQIFDFRLPHSCDVVKKYLKEESDIPHYVCQTVIDDNNRTLDRITVITIALLVLIILIPLMALVSFLWITHRFCFKNF
ncbi:hypothetical protein SNEBB_007252 [Seison nebaliae]|nr:hypothetical protein SNEBB_007252 [Seison nebaliae]